MNKLWLCGITSIEVEKIRDLIYDTQDIVDGYVWCVDSNIWSNATYMLLEKSKKDGMIVRHRWQNAHDWQANEWLHCGKIQTGDWVWMFDSSEKPTTRWINNVREDIKKYEQSYVGAVYMSARPYLFKFYDHQYFFGTPHWGLIGAVGKSIVIPEEKKFEWIINKRDDNPAKHYQEHDTKYYLYGRSNQMQAFYSKYLPIHGGIIDYHETIRLQFREYLRQKTEMKPSLTALDELFKKPLEEYAIAVVDLEFCLSEYYQRTIVNMDFMKDIVPKRYLWSIKQHLKNGDGFSDPNYVSTKMKYENLLIMKKNINSN